MFGTQLLAGADVNECTPQKQTALHIAATHDHAKLCSILVENGVDYDMVDDGLNNGKPNIGGCVILPKEKL